MERFEFGKKHLHFNVGRLAAIALCICMFLVSVDVKVYAESIGAAAGQMEEWITGDSIDSTGYAFVTPDITPDQEYDFGAVALSKSRFTKRVGDSVEMKIYAWSKSGTLTYTWYAPSGEELESETGDTLKIDSLADEEGFGRYHCQIEDGASGNRKILWFYVYKDARLAIKPVSNSSMWAYIGQEVTFEVEAADYGSEIQSFTYQWYKGSKEIAGANEAVYTFQNTVQAGKRKRYRCVASNGTETAECKFWVYSTGINVINILNNYETARCKTGSEVSLIVEAESEYLQDQLSYQWYRGNIYLTNGTVEELGSAEMIEGATDAGYTLIPETSGTYSCLVSDGYTQAVYQKYISVMEHDVSVSIGNEINGASLNLSAEVAKTDDFKGELSYQWYKISDTDGGTQRILLEGQTQENLLFDPVTEDDLGQYLLEVSWGDGETAEDSRSIGKRSFRTGVLTPTVLKDVQAPITYIALDGYEQKQLEGVSYQWYQTKSGETQIMPGETERTLVVNYPEDTKDCSYSCKVIINGFECESNSAGSLLEIDPAGSDWTFNNSLRQNIIYNRKHDEEILLDPGLIRGNAADLNIIWEETVNYGSDWEQLACEDAVYRLDIDELDDSANHQFRITVVDESGREETVTFSLQQEQTLALNGANLPSVSSLSPISAVYVFYGSGDVGGMNPGTGTDQPGGTVWLPVWVALGDSYTMHCEAISTEGEIFYQWEKRERQDEYGWEEIEGAESADYLIESASYEDSGVYRCVISDGNQTKYYEFAFYVTDSPQYIWFTTPDIPNPSSVRPGEKNISIRVKVMSYSGTDIQEECRYQWIKVSDGVRTPVAETDRISGTDTDTLSFAEVKQEDYGYYICEVTYQGYTYTMGYDLYWSGVQWKGKYSYSSFYAKNGESVYLQTVTDAPEGDITYQWYCGETEIPGATGANYLVMLTDDEAFGRYFCEVTVNGCTSRAGASIYYMESEDNYTKVLAKESYSGTKNMRLNIGDTVDMGAVAYFSRAGEISYQWQVCTASDPVDGTYKFENIPGAVQPDYQTVIRSENDYGTYRCEVLFRSGDTNWIQYVNYGLYPPKQENAPAQNPGQSTALIAVTGVTISQTSVELVKGSQMTLKAAVAPTNAANKTVSWSSSNPKVAEVKNGIVTAKESGNAVITVTTADGAKTASCNVKVVIPAEKVMLLKSKGLKIGEDYQLKVTLAPQNSTDSITYSSSNQKVATISAGGKVKAVAAGTAKITAKAASGKKAVCTIYVVKKKIPALKVNLSSRKVNMKSGGLLQLQAVMTPVKNTDDLKWSSSNKKIAQVDANGVVTARRSGIVKITVKTTSGKKDTCKIKITQPAQSVELSKKSLTLKQNGTYQLKAKMKPSDATDKLTWKSSNKKIVSVDKKGRLTALKKGKATITVRTSSGRIANCKVTVK